MSPVDWRAPMADPMRLFSPRLVTVFGGSGFLGRYVVRALAKRRCRVRVAVRRPNLAGHVQPIGAVGQIQAVQANLRFPATVQAAVRDAEVVVNLAGILQESGPPEVRRRPGGRRAGCRRSRSSRGGARHPRLGDRGRPGLQIGLCPLESRGRGRGAPGAAGCGRFQALRHVRPRRQLFQPLRDARPPAAGAAARRCGHALPAGLRRRRVGSDRARRGWPSRGRAASTNSAARR